ncbi:MAG TPA: response regulator, partial [Ramlibacter sp.]|nr:response regulator [Ramlibacter sp.]
STAREAAAREDDPLLHPSIFGPDLTPPKPAAALPAAEPVATLKLAVKGLRPIERQLLEGLVKVSQRRTPRLEILGDAQAREANAVMIDTRDAQAMAWARQQPWLSRRAVIWIDGTEAQPGHTLVRRPVQWPILPMLLARALESGPAASAPETSTIVAPAAPARIAAVAGSAPQILVVDDSLAVRAHLRSLLDQRGYAVTDADSVEVAMQTLAQRKFDCVLMDVLMPDVDGYEGCHRIKARLRGADAVPVVMLTSKGSPFDRIRGKMAGCDAYLTKPVDPQHLTEVLAQQVKAVPVRRINAPEPAQRTGHAPLSPRFVPTRPV